VLPDKKTFELVARQLGISEAFVEKDWHVTQAIRAIANITLPGFNLVFSGGTALSKAHRLIQRFSEDIDFIIFAPEKTQSRKSRSDLKHAVLKSLRDAGFRIEDNQVKARNENRFFVIEMDYETSFSRPNSLRPHIQIELIVKTTQLPAVALPVSSFVTELTNQPPEVESIGCINVVENAADKLSALAWRIPDRVRGDPDDDPAIVRHIHDLAMLKDIALAHEKFPSLVNFCMRQDDNRAKNNRLSVGLSMHEKFENMLSIFDTDSKYPREYDQFVKGVSYSAEDATPDFRTAVAAIKVLIEIVGKS